MTSLSILFAATLVVWNLMSVPISVVLDDVFQCRIDPHHACEITGISAGQHRVDTGSTISYISGEGKNPSPGRITLANYRSTWKTCRFPTGLIPDACEQWIRDANRLEPPDTPIDHVTVKH